MLRNLFLLMISLTVMFFVSCSDDDDNGTNSNIDDILAGTYKCKVDGSDWTPVQKLSSLDDDGTVTITGSSFSGTSVALTFTDAEVGSGNDGRAIVGISDIANPVNSKTYSTHSVTFEITKLTDTQVVGTFSFTADEDEGDGQVVVTNGEFNLEFNM